MKTGSKDRFLATTLLAGMATLGVPLAAGVAVVSTATPAHADSYTTSDLTGRVTDSSGAPVSGAQVTVLSSQGGTRTVTSGSDGRFVVSSLAFGSYSVSISASGYDTVSNEAVTVGGGSNSFDFTLAHSGESQTIVVTATRVQDFNRTDTGLSVDVQELASRVPLGRSVYNVTRLAPTAQDTDPTIVGNGVRRNQNIVSLSGTSAAESVYYINGLNVTDQRTFLGYADLPFDAVQSIDVKTGGYSAEFGRATGGVVNIVTRSGSNEFHGGASAFYTPNSLRADAKNTFGTGGTQGNVTYNNFSSAENYDSDVWLSGAIVPNHVFFFGMINPRKQETCGGVGSLGLTGSGLTNGTQECTQSDTPRWLGKLDVNFTENQRLEATIFSDADKLDVRDCSNFDTTVGGCNGSYDYHSERSGGTDQIYRYTGVFTDWFTLSALYGQVLSQYTDESSNFGTAYTADLRGGSAVPLTSVINPGPFEFGGEDTRDTYRIDADFKVSLFGDHHFRIGYDDEELHSTDLSGYTSGCYYQYRNTESAAAGGPVPTNAAYHGDYIRRTCYASGGSFDAQQSALYIQDSWQPTDRLTLQLGVRNDRYNYKTASNETFIDITDQWAPRLGFTYDLFGNGEDKIYGSFGQYYLPVAENTAIREAAAAPYNRDFFAVPGGDGADPELDGNGIPTLGASVGPQLVYSAATAPDAKTVAAQNIEPMYTQEYSIGWSHTFDQGTFENWHVGVNYTDRKLQSTIEDTALQNRGPYTDGFGVAHPYGDGPIGRYCQRTGIAAADCQTDAYAGVFTLINPGRDMIVWADPDGSGAHYITLTQADLDLPKASNHYQALEFTFERPFDGTWGLQGSYVLSKSYGNYEGAVKSDIGQTDTSITQDFDNPYVEQYATGYLPNDHRHTIKIFGTYAPFENFTMGAAFRAQSGRPYGCIGFNPNDPNPPPTPSNWYCNYSPTPRGSVGTTPWTYNVDLSFSYKIPMANEAAATTLYLDVFNLFDQQEETRVVEYGDASNGTPDASPVVPPSPEETYGLVRTRQAPRTVRFGIRYAF